MEYTIKGLSIYKGNAPILANGDLPEDCDLILKVSGTDPIYLLTNAEYPPYVKKLYTFIPDSDGIVKVKFDEPIKSIQSMFDWTASLWEEYNLGLPDNYGDRFLTIIGLNNLISKYRVENYWEPFWDNHNLVILENLENLDVSSCTKLGMVISGSSYHVSSLAENITKLDLSSWDTSKVTEINSVVDNLPNLKELHVSNWDTSNVTNFYDVVHDVGIETLDISNWDTRNATSMWGMFDGLKSCTEIIVGPNFKTSQCTDLSSFYKDCTNLTKPPQLDTSNCTKLNNLFLRCNELVKVPWELDVSKVNSINYYCVSNCPKLQYIVFKGIGTTELANIQLVLGTSNQWGAGSEENRQSLVDSLLTYSNDRASKGMSVATITIGATNKARLTAEEIAAIEAKGYKIQ